MSWLLFILDLLHISNMSVLYTDQGHTFGQWFSGYGSNPPFRLSM